MSAETELYGTNDISSPPEPNNIVRNALQGENVSVTPEGANSIAKAVIQNQGPVHDSYDTAHLNIIKEQKSRADERRKSKKRILQYYTKERAFKGTFESNWPNRLANYIKNCKHWDVPNNEKVFFSRYSLAENCNARHYYDILLKSAGDKTAPLSRKIVCESFATRFASITKQTEISSSLDVIRFEDVRSEEDDDYMALEKVTPKIDQLAPMARRRDRDDKLKLRFLTVQSLKHNGD